eukprot:TRINITY_DN33830_c0_g1_i2.p1 TRINITY_DN33830_c0_g1~~TRINITY_DN33830_c0_g1_i2.p1  ORF type:complete len:901 (-),score=221.13 TRINITY_DN33830_c0_g1_i2:118-2820(-)
MQPAPRSLSPEMPAPPAYAPPAPFGAQNTVGSYRSMSPIRMPRAVSPLSHRMPATPVSMYGSSGGEHVVAAPLSASFTGTYQGQAGAAVRREVSPLPFRQGGGALGSVRLSTFADIGGSSSEVTQPVAVVQAAKPTRLTSGPAPLGEPQHQQASPVERTAFPASPLNRLLATMPSTTQRQAATSPLRPVRQPSVGDTNSSCATINVPNQGTEAVRARGQSPLAAATAGLRGRPISPIRPPLEQVSQVVSSVFRGSDVLGVSRDVMPSTQPAEPAKVSHHIEPSALKQTAISLKEAIVEQLTREVLSAMQERQDRHEGQLQTLLKRSVEGGSTNVSGEQDSEILRHLGTLRLHLDAVLDREAQSVTQEQLRKTKEELAETIRDAHSSASDVAGRAQADEEQLRSSLREDVRADLREHFATQLSAAASSQALEELRVQVGSSLSQLSELQLTVQQSMEDLRRTPSDKGAVADSWTLPSDSTEMAQDAAHLRDLVTLTSERVDRFEVRLEECFAQAQDWLSYTQRLAGVEDSVKRLGLMSENLDACMSRLQDIESQSRDLAAAAAPEPGADVADRLNSLERRVNKCVDEAAKWEALDSKIAQLRLDQETEWYAARDSVEDLEKKVGSVTEVAARCQVLEERALTMQKSSEQLANRLEVLSLAGDKAGQSHEALAAHHGVLRERLESIERSYGAQGATTISGAAATDLRVSQLEQQHESLHGLQAGFFETLKALEKRLLALDEQQQQGHPREAEAIKAAVVAVAAEAEKPDAALSGRLGYLEGLLGDAVGSYASLDDRFLATETAQAHLEERMVTVDGHVTSVQRAMAKLRLEAMQKTTGATSVSPPQEKRHHKSPYAPHDPKAISLNPMSLKLPEEPFVARGKVGKFHEMDGVMDFIDKMPID